MHCGTFMSWRDPCAGVYAGDPIPQCLLQEHHEGPHLIQLADGSFLSWAFDDVYCGEGCQCRREEFIECFHYGEESPQEALKLLAPLDYMVQPLLAERQPIIRDENQYELFW